MEVILRKIGLKIKAFNLLILFYLTLILKKKFTINNKGYIHIFSEFGYSDKNVYELQLYNNFLSNNNFCRHLTDYKNSYSKQYELTNGDACFKVEETEVFKINYI